MESWPGSAGASMRGPRAAPPPPQAPPAAALGAGPPAAPPPAAPPPAAPPPAAPPPADEAPADGFRRYRARLLATKGHRPPKGLDLSWIVGVEPHPIYRIAADADGALRVEAVDDTETRILRGQLAWR